MSALGTVGLLYHPMVAEAKQLAEQLCPVVEGVGHTVWMASAWASEQLLTQESLPELLIVLGGDGTILRVARATLRRNEAGVRETPPLLTVDFGTLGFLAELEPEQAAEGVTQVLSGERHWLEERYLLRATLRRKGEIIAQERALNDIVLARGDGPHALRLALRVDGVLVERYTADGIIVASPTGSTAYAQGVGGPIMSPEIEGMLIAPIAPHFAMVRSLVVPTHSEVQLSATARREMVVAIDGQRQLSYRASDEVLVTGSAARARFVRLGEKNCFYQTFRNKLTRQ